MQLLQFIADHALGTLLFFGLLAEIVIEVIKAAKAQPRNRDED